MASSESFKLKARITGRIIVEIVVPLKYLSKLWKTLEITLINFETNLKLTWSANLIITNVTAVVTFAITNTRQNKITTTIKFRIKKNS